MHTSNNFENWKVNARENFPFTNKRTLIRFCQEEKRAIDASQVFDNHLFLPLLDGQKS